MSCQISLSNPTRRFGRNPRRARRSALFGLVLGLLALAAGASPAAAIVPLGQFGEGSGEQSGLLGGPVGVAVDRTGRVYVAEVRDRVSVFSPQGAFLRAFGKDVVPGNDETGFEQCTTVCKEGEEGGDAGELDTPQGISVDAEGLVYVSEFDNNRISVFDQQGGFVRTFGKDVDLTDDDTGFEVCDSATCKAGEAGGGPGDLDGPAGIAIDAAGVVWVADARNSRVSLYSRSGEFLRAFGKRVDPLSANSPDVCTTTCTPGLRSDVAGAFGAPVAAAVDAAGNVYVSEQANQRVSVFSPDLAFRRAFGEDVVPGNADTGFEVCTAASGCKTGTAGDGAGALGNATGTAVGADRNLYVAQVQQHRVSVFTRQGAFRRAFGKDVVPGNNETGFEECTGSCKAGVPGAGPGEMNLPVLLSFDCRGALYVPEADNGRVQRFGAPGTPTPPCGRRAARSRPFGIMKVSRNTRNGAATLTIAVPWSAEIRLRGRGIKHVTRQVEFAGRARLALRPKRRARRLLDQRGKLRVRARVTYWPWGAKPRMKTRVVVLRKRPAPRG